MKTIWVLTLLSLVLTSCSKKPSTYTAAQEISYISSQGYSLENKTFTVPVNNALSLTPLHALETGSYSVTGLPNELLYSSSTGEISGTPTSVHSYKIFVTKINGNKILGKGFYYINVISAIAPTYLNYEHTDFNLQKNTNYNLKVISSSGNFLKFTKTTLPTGFDVDLITGSITGSYAGPGGTFNSNIIATNSAGTYSKSLSFTFPCIANYTNVNGVCLLANQTRTCLTQPANSTGGQELSVDSGTTWGACSSFTCDATYVQIASSCVLSNQIRSCLTQPLHSNGGTETTTNGGISWGSCSSYSCDATYTNVAGSCVSTNQTRSCLTQPSNSTGGIESSSNGGGSWGSCSTFICDASYTNVSGICVSTNQTRTCLTQPSNSTGGIESSSNGGVSWGSCSTFNCNASYTNVAGSCFSTNQTRTCLTQPANSTGGTESSSNGGISWGSCFSYSCDATYTNVSGICTLNSQTRSCLTQPANSTGGTETTSNAGTSWEPCSSFSCNATYTNVAGSCMSTNQTRTCLTQPANSTGGTEASSDGGVSWGSCSTFNCNTNYTNVAGSCVSTNQTRTCLTQPLNSTGGTEASANGGVTWGSCSSYSCDATYTNIAGSCVSTNQTRSCLTQPANSTGGTESSSDGGISWGSCSTFNCNASYTNISGTCSLTNQTRACLTQPSNSTGGTEASSDAGQNWGSCSSYNCDATYTNVAGSCVSTNQTRSCLTQPSNSTGGTEASSNGGVSWGACSSYSCDATYTNVTGSCVSTNQTRSCLTQPSNSTGGTEASTDGGVTWGSCLSFTCSAGYTSNGSVCNINSYSLTVTKITSQASVSDITLGLLTASSADTSVSASYNHGQMIVLEATPDSGFAVTNWTGCDSVSNDLLRCTISSLTAARTVTPTMTATYHSVIATLSNSDFDSYVSIDYYKNGVLCSGACLNQYLFSDTVKIVITPNSSLSDVSAFNLTGTYSSLNTSTTNEVSFVMGTTNISIVATILDKDISIFNNDFAAFSYQANHNELGYLGAAQSVTNHYVYFSSSSPLRLFFKVNDAAMINDRSILIYAGLNCGGTPTESSSVGLNYVDYNITVNLNNSNEYSYKVKNINKTSSCYNLTGFQQSSIVKSRETIISNIAIEASSGYSSFFTDTTNTVSGDCVTSASLGSPSQYTYNYGLTQWRSTGITILAKAYMNTDLVNPFYTQSQDTSCDANASSTYGVTFSQNSNFVTADVIKYSVTFKNQFDASYNEVLTLNKESTTRSCVITNGTGTQSYISNGTYSACSIVSCNATYTNVGGSCVLTNQTRTCSSQPTNSTGGTEASSNGGVTWGACSSYSCDASYTNVAGSCVLTNQTRTCSSQPTNSTGGTEASSNGGVTWGSCSSFTCNANYMVNGSVCEAILIPHLKNYSTATDNACVINSAGKAYCSGWNGVGSNGDGTNTDAPSPVAVSTTGVLSGKTIKQISVGENHVCAIASDNLGYCWGDNTNGQLGNNTVTASNIPVSVSTTGVLSGKTLKWISAGGYFTCAIASDNLIYCWGKNDQGQLGTASTTEAHIPVAVSTAGVLSGKTILQVTSGLYTACVVGSDYNAYCWGKNVIGSIYGMLGNNTTVAKNTSPVAVYTAGVLSGKTIRQISGRNDEGFCVIASDNKAYCWGDSGDGQLGNNTWSSSKVPVAVSTTGVLSSKNIKSIENGHHHSCALTDANTIACWGRGVSGQLGDGLVTASPTPVNVNMTGVLSGKTIIGITTGWYESCALTSESKFYCWGWNNSGVFGDSTYSESDIPTPAFSGLSF